jgi:WD40 repeat protein
MAEETKEPITTPIRTFDLNEDKERSAVLAITVFRNEQRMVTASRDMTLRLWELKDGVVLKTMEGHREWVRAVAVSGDGKLIASGDDSGELMAWNGDSGESLTKAIRSHSSWVRSLDFSPNGAVLATGSSDSTTKLWSTTTWQLLGDPIECNDCVFCVQYSPSNEHLGIATSKNIQIWNPDMMQLVSKFTGDSVVPGCIIFSLAWPPDGKCLLSVGDSSIREWDTLTWQQVGKSWEGHTSRINTIAIHPAGTLVASASEDKHVHLWRLSDRRTVATFQHSHSVRCVTFSTNGKHLLSVGDNKISEWGIPEDYLPKDDPKEEMIDEVCSDDFPPPHQLILH